MELIGDVKNVILVDDMIDTGGTLAKAADLMKRRKFERKSNLCHLIWRCLRKIENSQLLELIVTILFH
jgi:ribose-phosphate pyrophosphokinase